MLLIAPDVSQPRAYRAGVEVIGPSNARQSFLTELLPDGTCGLEGQELPLRIEPGLVESLNKQGTGSYTCQQEVLVEGHLAFVARILSVGRAIPVGKGFYLGGYILAKVAFRQRGAAATRLYGYYNGEAFVEGPSYQGCLAQARIAGE